MWIKAFKADDQPYIYSAWNNEILQIGEPLYEFFTDTSADRKEKLALAQHFDLLPADSPQLCLLPDDMIEESLAAVLRQGPNILVMSVTEACNFRCRYCAYSGAYDHARQHSNRSMPLVPMKKAARWYLSFPRETYRIGFYGGEPLLRLKQLKKLAAFIKDYLPEGATLQYSMTSNGWLLDGKAARFLVDNDFEVFVSLDGPPTYHDRYRRTVRGEATFERIIANLEALRDAHPDYYERRVNFAITVVPPADIAAIGEFLRSRPDLFGGKIPRVSPLAEYPPRMAEALGLAKSEIDVDFTPVQRAYLMTLVDGGSPDEFSRACSEPVVRKIHHRNMLAATQLRVSGGQCMPGRRCHVTVDGRLHMCEHGNDLFPIGHIDTGFDAERIRTYLHDYRRLFEAECRDCWAVRLCMKCIPSVSQGDRLSCERRNELCRRQRRAIENALVAYCQARRRKDNCFDGLTTVPDDQTKLSSQEGELL